MDKTLFSQGLAVLFLQKKRVTFFDKLIFSRGEIYRIS